MQYVHIYNTEYAHHIGQFPKLSPLIAGSFTERALQSFGNLVTTRNMQIIWSPLFSCSFKFLLRKEPHNHLAIASQHPSTPRNTLQHAATHCIALQRTATLCNTLQRLLAVPATLRSTLHHQRQLLVPLARHATISSQHPATLRNRLQHSHCNTRQHTTTTTHSSIGPTVDHIIGRAHPDTPCNTLQHTATRCNTLQHAATHCNTLIHPATRCNIHTATHCNNTHNSQFHWPDSGLHHRALQHTHCNTLQHTAAHCNNTHNSQFHWPDILLYHRACCNTLQHAATHYNNNSQFHWPDTLLYHHACLPPQPRPFLFLALRHVLIPRAIQDLNHHLGLLQKKIEIQITRRGFES